MNPAVVLLLLSTPAIAQVPALVPRQMMLREEKLEPRFERLKGLHRPLARPRPGDWLAQHHEAGQSVAEYAASSPVRATPERRTLYLQPVGDFTPKQKEVMALTGCR